MKIGQYLAKIWTRVQCATFFETRCIYIYIHLNTHASCSRTYIRVEAYSFHPNSHPYQLSYHKTQLHRRSFIPRSLFHSVYNISVNGPNLFHLLVACAVFTAWYTLVQSTVLRSHVVCLSICPSVMLMDCDHIDWNSSKIISPSVSLDVCSLQLKHDGCTTRGMPLNFHPNRVGCWKKWLSAYKSFNISETSQDRTKVTSITNEDE